MTGTEGRFFQVDRDRAIPEGGRTFEPPVSGALCTVSRLQSSHCCFHVSRRMNSDVVTAPAGSSPEAKMSRCGSGAKSCTGHSEMHSLGAAVCGRGTGDALSGRGGLNALRSMWASMPRVRALRLMGLL